MYFLTVKLVQIYRGYADGPRNTDNAWVETVAFNYHDDTGEALGAFQLAAGYTCLIKLLFIHILYFIFLKSNCSAFILTITRFLNVKWLQDEASFIISKVT